MKTTYEKPPKLSRRYLRDRKWVSAHIQELMGKYPDQWILVYDGEIVAHHAELGPVWDKADALHLEQPFFHLIEGGVRVY